MINTMIAYAVEDPNVGNIVCKDLTINNLTDFINYFTCTLMNAVVPLLVGLAVVAFVYGIIKYFLNPESEEKRKEGKSYMFWGLVTLFVMVSIWALVGIFASSLTPDKPLLIPSLPASQP